MVGALAIETKSRLSRGVRRKIGKAASLKRLAQMTRHIHISAPQFWDVGSGCRTDQLRIVEMEYGLQWFQWRWTNPTSPLGRGSDCNCHPAARFEYFSLHTEQPGGHCRKAVDDKRLSRRRV